MYQKKNPNLKLKKQKQKKSKKNPNLMMKLKYLKKNKKQNP